MKQLCTAKFLFSMMNDIIKTGVNVIVCTKFAHLFKQLIDYS